MKINLKYPVKDTDGATIASLEVGRPTVKHLKALDEAKGEVEKTARLIQELTGLSKFVVEQIDVEDFVQIGEVVADFFEKRPQIGGK